MDTYWLLGRTDLQEEEEEKAPVTKQEEDMPAFLQYFREAEPARPQQRSTASTKF